jgi:hypothetical protein
MITAQ